MQPKRYTGSCRYLSLFITVNKQSVPPLMNLWNDESMAELLFRALLKLWTFAVWSKSHLANLDSRALRGIVFDGLNRIECTTKKT